MRYKIIKCDCSVKDMTLEEVKYGDLEKVSAWRKRNLKHELWVSIFACIFVLYFMFKTSGLLFKATNNEMFLIWLFAMLFELFFIFVIVSAKLKFLKKFKKLQYAIVNDVYFKNYKDSDGHKHKRHFASVCFTRNSRNLDDVEVIGKSISTVSQGDEVIVVSFNNKTSYIISLKDYE